MMGRGVLERGEGFLGLMLSSSFLVRIIVPSCS